MIHLLTNGSSSIICAIAALRYEITLNLPCLCDRIINLSKQCTWQIPLGGTGNSREYPALPEFNFLDLKN